VKTPFLESKSDVLSKFKEFKALVENIFERKIKTLRSHNGGEFTSNKFNTFCKEVGIKRKIATPYNPRQNGVEKRKNRAIMEEVKSMIHYQDLPMHFLVEAARITMICAKHVSPPSTWE
jgi:transposase InsO family protein